MKMLIMGAPGSGKGTQSEILVEKLGIPTISTGAMLRAAIAEGTEVGKEASKYINDGTLVLCNTLLLANPILHIFLYSYSVQSY